MVMAARLLDPLCCQEDHLWVDEDDQEHHPQQPQALLGTTDRRHLLFLLQWENEEEEELKWLSTKEAEIHHRLLCLSDPFTAWIRKEAAAWLVRAAARLGFFPQTAVLAVDFLDRFLSRKRVGEERHPWMAQLSAVACLSLAAKVEETSVPLLLDLQVEETRFVFEPRTIQRMELLVLSTLGWRMNPVTPLSFIDHVVRRMGSDETHWEFQSRCHCILLTLVADSRWVEYSPSVLAAATMLYCLEQMGLICCSSPSSSDCENQLLFLLNKTKEEVHCCYQFILDSMAGGICVSNDNANGGLPDHNGNGSLGGGGGECIESNKRKYSSSQQCTSPRSPHGFVGSTFSCDSSNDSWAAASSTVSSASAASSPEHRPSKRPSAGWPDVASPRGRLMMHGSQMQTGGR